MRSRIRFYIPLAIFVIWLAWLAFLALTQTNKQIVSRAQLMKANAAVVVELSPEQMKQNAPVTVMQILWGELAGLEVNKPIQVTNLKNARLSDGKELSKPSQILMFLTPAGESGQYEIAVAPRSPNLGPLPKESKTLEYPWEEHPPIYTWTPEIEKQAMALQPK
ncbi:MAG: hypothetical protein N2112_05895 [Gemmataceae bacterium]|nr:hypothetical protein [Gemmataceae bacterium]